MRRARSDSFPFPFLSVWKTSVAVKQVQSGFEFGVAHPPGQASGFLIVRYARDPRSKHAQAGKDCLLARWHASGLGQ